VNEASDSIYIEFSSYRHHDETKFYMNSRGDLLDLEFEWVGRLNGKEIDRSVPEPDYLSNVYLTGDAPTAVAPPALPAIPAHSAHCTCRTCEPIDDEDYNSDDYGSEGDSVVYDMDAEDFDDYPYPAAVAMYRPAT
jgi:hypothetical protein